MLFYIVTTFLVLLCGCTISMIKDTVSVKAIRVFLFLYLSFFAAFRYDIGIDYQHYLVIFENIKNGGVIYLHSEPLFYFIIRIFVECNLSFSFFIAFCAIITNFFFLSSIDNKTYFLQIIIFYMLYYVNSFCIIRQMMGLSFTIYAFSRCNDRKKKQLLYILLACLVHRFFWLVFILYIASYFIRLNSEQVLLIALISFIIFVPTHILESLLFKLLDIINFNVGKSNLFFQNRIGLGMLLRYVYTVCFYIVFMHRRQQNYLINLLFLSLCMAEIGGTKLPILATRLALSFSSVYFLMMSEKHFNQRLLVKGKVLSIKNFILFIGLLAMLLLFFASLIKEPHFNEAMPYKMLRLY